MGKPLRKKTHSNKVLRFRVTPGERKIVMANARREKLSLSDYLRTVAIGFAC